MPSLPKIEPARGGRHRWWAAVRSVGAFGILWWMLAGQAPESWFVGIPAVLAGAWLSRPGKRRFSVSLLGLFRFLPWFLRESLRGALDVAQRALRPALPLQPEFVEVTVRLPDGAPRITLAQVISLLPGTLSADLVGRRLVIHALDAEPDIEALAADLERRIAALFGVTLESSPDRGPVP